MALRLVELIIEEGRAEEVHGLLEGHTTIGFWAEPLSEERALFRILLPAEHSEAVLDAAESRFSGRPDFRALVFDVRATVPRPEAPEDSDEVEPVGPATDEPEQGAAARLRISREELFSDIVDLTRFSPSFAATVALSTVVAAVGMLRADVAVVIGAMVIAPLLGPNMALALASTMGDRDLAVRAIRISAAGAAIAFGLSTLLGLVLSVDPTVHTLADRTDVRIEHVALALASGAAGALAFTSGISTAVIGVMVAVALLPPLVAVGVLLGAGELRLAGRALLLLVTNIVCVNLAGTITFLAHGIRPRTWWEADRAKKATRVALAIWSALLVATIVVILLLTST